MPNSQLAWSPDAERRLERVPEFIRPMIRQSIEHFAAEHGYRLITPEVMAEARGAFGM
ncbi:MAG: PCP reductase family protein [candidate division NC10 bacterium]|nr:PCP reductase family protein [candidate division NC10 bacterium]